MRIDDFELTTERLLLRLHRPEDAGFMSELNSDPEVVRYTGDGALRPKEAEEIIESLRRQFRESRTGRFIVVERSTARRIGWCGLKRLPENGEIDLGYRFLREAWAKGYATEAGAACLKYGFETLGFRRITARVAAGNAASLNVLDKLGMTQCAPGPERALKFEIAAT